MLKIGFAQCIPDYTLSQALSICGRASSFGCDILLFPEMWNIGYEIGDDNPQLWLDRAVSIDSPYVSAFQEEAEKLGLAIVVTLLEKTEKGARNTAVLIDRHGTLVQVYAKVHTCDFSSEACLIPGSGFETSILDTAQSPVKTGLMICFDREFPESARILMLQGAELILVPNACPMEINRLSQLRARAFENMTAIATCNYPSGKDECNGKSSLFDGIAYDESGSRDMCAFLAPESEGLFAAQLDLEALRAYRKSEVHGNCYRKPERYSLLTAPAVEAPFIRADRRK